MVRWDGELRAFDDPARNPGEPWVLGTGPGFHKRIERDPEDLRGESFVRAAVACQRVARAAMIERDERIRQAVVAGANVAELAELLGLDRQQVYAISNGT